MYKKRMESLAGIKILIGPSSFAAMDKTPLERLISAGCEIINNPYKRKLTKEEIISLLSEDIKGLLAGLEPLDREVLKKSKLKVISRVGSGLSNVDLDAAKDLGIKICSTPFGPTNAVAELTVGAMLSLIRKIHEMNRDLHNNKWNKKIGMQLEGKCVVIIGFGRIGSRVTELLSCFKINILVVDPFLKSDDIGYSILPLRDALPEADLISIHCSGDECILKEKEFSLMKQGVYLLNAARGGLISESSLIKALDNGRIAGVWLDTFESEPYSGPLTKYEQVILTPHVGSYTYECRKQMETEAVTSLINALARP